jgi:hypothetical protein
VLFNKGFDELKGEHLYSQSSSLSSYIFIVNNTFGLYKRDPVLITAYLVDYYIRLNVL